MRPGSEVRLETLTNEDTSALGHLERCFFGENRPYDGDCSMLHVREAATLYSEVEQAAADIRRLLAAGSAAAATLQWPPETWRTTWLLSRPCLTVMEYRPTSAAAADILEKPVLSLLTGVLASISGGYEYEDMFRWLKTGPRRYHGGGVRCAGKLCPEVGNSRPDVAAGGGLDGKSGRIRRAVE